MKSHFFSISNFKTHLRVFFSLFFFFFFFSLYCRPFPSLFSHFEPWWSCNNISTCSIEKLYLLRLVVTGGQVEFRSVILFWIKNHKNTQTISFVSTFLLSKFSLFTLGVLFTREKSVIGRNIYSEHCAFFPFFTFIALGNARKIFSLICFFLLEGIPYFLSPPISPGILSTLVFICFYQSYSLVIFLFLARTHSLWHTISTYLFHLFSLSHFSRRTAPRCRCPNAVSFIKYTKNKSKTSFPWTVKHFLFGQNFPNMTSIFFS